MASSRFTAILLVIGMAAPLLAQNADTAQNTARQTLSLLADLTIDAKPFKEPMPLAKFLDAVEKQLPKDKRIALRIDNAAYGDKVKEVAATPVSLFPGQTRVSVQTALERAIAKIKTKSDFRIDGTQVTITTLDRSLFTLEHDIRDLLAKSESVGLSGPAFRNADQAERAASLVKRIAALTEPTQPLAGETIEIVNGARLAIRTAGMRHRELSQTLRALARLADLAVTTQCKLYEVDDAFYTKLKNAKRISIEEEERIFLEGKQPKGVTLAEFLAKQKLIATGDDVTVDNGQSATLLSRQEVRHCLPGVDQVHKGLKTRQTFLTGIVFSGNVSVRPDRRFVRMQLAERATELLEIQKRKVFANRLGVLGVAFDEFPVQVNENPWKELLVEKPILRENTRSEMLELPDGGTRLVPVHHRPRSLEEQKRWLVLVIASRIVMEEEERRILDGSVEQIVPTLVADLLTNPRLKATRDYVGTPGDKRFALINNDAWTWPKEFQPKIKGFDLTPANPKGNRLLGLRIDAYQVGTEPGTTLAIRVTLVNAGGSGNGPAPGGCTLRYSARSGDKGWKVELVE
ncbi:MAG: hypothetical protein HYR84_08035 [Planctomycetes bacterium]|nr:hypothetical protein [Planctomycetota bacterium]